MDEIFGSSALRRVAEHVLAVVRHKFEKNFKIETAFVQHYLQAARLGQHRDPYFPSKCLQACVSIGAEAEWVTKLIRPEEPEFRSSGLAVEELNRKHTAKNGDVMISSAFANCVQSHGVQAQKNSGERFAVLFLLH